MEDFDDANARNILGKQVKVAASFFDKGYADQCYVDSSNTNIRNQGLNNSIDKLLEKINAREFIELFNTNLRWHRDSGSCVSINKLLLQGADDPDRDKFISIFVNESTGDKHVVPASLQTAVPQQPILIEKNTYKEKLDTTKTQKEPKQRARSTPNTTSAMHIARTTSKSYCGYCITGLKKIGSHRPKIYVRKEQHDTVMVVQCTFASAVRD